MNKHNFLKTLSLLSLFLMLAGSLTSCGDKGDTGAQGNTGEKGDTGETGKTGADGEDGTNGTNGIDGLDGSTVLTGSDAPLATLGNNGDSYIDTKTFDYYVKKSDVWTKIGNIKGNTGVGETGASGDNGTMIITGEGTPDTALGNNGDSYIDLDKWVYYVKESGTWVSKGSFKGSAGKTGASGAAGVAGKDGKAFLTGTTIPASTLGNEGDSYLDTSTGNFYLKTSDGWGTSLGNINGTTGLALLLGSTIPADTLGKNGDSYINTTNWDYYVKSSSGWNKIGNLKGADGAVVLTGTTVPADTLGKNGDSYINTTTWDYYVKASGTWGTAKGNIRGSATATVMTGSGIPASSLGKNGDSYIDTTTWIYYVKEDDAWLNKGNIKGDTGTTGSIGDKGDQGSDGSAGSKGPDGVTGEKGDTGKTAYASTILPSDYGYVTTSVGSAVVGGDVSYYFYPDTSCSLKSVKINGVEKFAGVTGDDKVIAEGEGYTYSTTMVENGFVVQAEFDDVPTEITLPITINGASCETVGNHIYVFGGYQDSRSNKSIYDINTINGLVTKLDISLPVATDNIESVVYGKHIYLFGGSTNDGNTNAVYDFDTTTKTFISEHQTTMSLSLYSVTCSISGSNILVFGGFINQGAVSNLVQYFSVNADYSLTHHDDATVTCTNAAKGMTSAVIGDYYYLFGGKYNNSTYYGGIQQFRVSESSVYKTTNEMLFSYSGTAPESAYSCSAAVGDHIYLFGGQLASGYTDKIYDYNAPYSSGGSIGLLSGELKASSGFMCCSVVGQYVYIIGGYNGSSSFNTVQIFDTATKTIL